MYRTLFSLVLVFAFALGIVGFTFSASREEEADYRFINGAEAKTLDPHLATGEPEGRIITALFEGLTRRDARTLEAAPGVAESWTLSDDLLTYRFQLRQDARWSDGSPITAADFVYSWKRLLDPSLGSEYAYILFPVRLAEAYNAYQTYAKAITGPIRKSLDALIQETRQQKRAVEAATWQRFLASNEVHGPLKPTKNGLIRELLSFKAGKLELSRLEDFAGALEQEAKLLERAHDEAVQRLGQNAGFFAEDAHTFVVELVAPTPYFLEITSFYSTMPVPAKVVEAPGNRLGWFLPNKIISNGPFVLGDWRVNQRTRLLRNPTYWGKGEVKANIVDALPVEQATTALNLYLTGEAQWLPSNYPNDLVGDLKARPDFYSGPGLIVYYYRFNNARKPFNDRRVRKAFNLAVDRQLIVDHVLRLGQIPARTFVPPGLPSYRPPESLIDFNVEQAKQLLAEAGYPGGAGFPEVGLLYNTNESHKKIAEVVADQLHRNLGVVVKAYNQEWQSYIATTRNQDFDMARAGWIGDYSDPNTFLDMWVTNGGNNQTGFSSPVYDQLIASAANPAQFLENPDDLLSHLKNPEAIRRDLEMAKSGSGPNKSQAWNRIRLELLREAEAILVQDEFPIMPVYFYVVSGLVSPKLRGFYTELERPDGSRGPNLKDLHPLRDIWVEAESP